MIYKDKRSDEDRKRIDAFNEELGVLLDKYKVEISHEDGHGAFILILLDDAGKETEHHWSTP